MFIDGSDVYGEDFRFGCLQTQSKSLSKGGKEFLVKYGRIYLIKYINVGIIIVVLGFILRMLFEFFKEEKIEKRDVEI